MQDKNVLENLQLHYLQYLVIIDVSSKEYESMLSKKLWVFSGFSGFPPTRES